MRAILTILISLCTLQPKSQTYQLKKQIPSMSAMYVAGIFDGTAETLKFHYSNFSRVFPNSNPNYWNPQISWTNKYRNSNYALGPKYFGSTTFLVWTTDGYHMMRFGRNTMFLCTVISLSREKKKFKHLLFDAVLNSSAYHLGFWTSYETIFKDGK